MLARGLAPKVRLRLTDQVTSQLIVDAVRTRTERRAISRRAEAASRTGMPVPSGG